jgi:hypothetical protein
MSTLEDSLRKKSKREKWHRLSLDISRSFWTTGKNTHCLARKKKKRHDCSWRVRAVMVSTSAHTSNLHSRCFLKEVFIRLMRAAKNGDVRCNDSFLVLLWSTLRRMIYEKLSFFTVDCVVSASGILRNDNFSPVFLVCHLSSIFIYLACIISF